MLPYLTRAKIPDKPFTDARVAAVCGCVKAKTGITEVCHSGDPVGNRQNKLTNTGLCHAQRRKDEMNRNGIPVLGYFLPNSKDGNMELNPCLVLYEKKMNPIT